jgi:cysteine-rich repeat protein
MTRIATTVFLWLAVYTQEASAQSIDLAALRRTATASTSSYTKQTEIYTHFVDPLAPAEFLPLCGNGRIDSSTDYANYYASHPSWSMWPMYNDTATGATKNVSLRLSIDEMCDDGNRLDGDGCSSDCVWRDALTPPCEVPLLPPTDHAPGKLSHEYVG